MALKGRWHKKINPFIQKFVGWYKKNLGARVGLDAEDGISRDNVKKDMGG
jgi:hypothetical protein